MYNIMSKKKIEIINKQLSELTIKTLRPTSSTHIGEDMIKIYKPYKKPIKIDQNKQQVKKIKITVKDNKQIDDISTDQISNKIKRIDVTPVKKKLEVRSCGKSYLDTSDEDSNKS